MTRISKDVAILFGLLFVLSILIPTRALSSPGLGTSFTSRPTTHTAHTGVDDPADAYDAISATYARIAYDKSEWEEVTTFSTSGAPTTEEIAFVDFHMEYESADGGTGENYRIIYYVGSSGPIVLQDWTGEAGAIDYLAGRVWTAQAEPNDGVWSWADVTNIRLRVEGGTGGGGAAYFYEHEAWVSVYSYQRATMSVNPASLTDPASPFSISVDIATVDDLYGWEFQLFYNNTILNGSQTTPPSEGAFLSGGGSTWFNTVNYTDSYNASHGIVWLTCTLTGNVAGVSGSGTLASITFTVPGGASGTTPLHLAGTKLAGYDQANTRLVLMRHDTADGSVTIAAVPEFPLGAALEIALIGVIFYIWRRKRKPSPEVVDRIRAPLQ